MAVLLLAAGLADYRTAPLNALAVAGGLVLAATPLAIFDVGCALTFGATLGILAGVGPGGRPRLPGARRVGRVVAAGPGAAGRVGVRGACAVPGLRVCLQPGDVCRPPPQLRRDPADDGRPGCRDAAVLPLRRFTAARRPRPAGWRTRPPRASSAARPWWTGGRGCRTGFRRRTQWCLRSTTAPGRPGSRRAPGRPCRRCDDAAPSSSCRGVWILVEPVTLLAPGVRGVLRVTFLDVGHADAVLVQLPDRRSLLVDTGGSLTPSSFDIGGRVLAPALWRLGTRRLEVLVLSHGDPDHVGGAASVIRDFRPREVWEGSRCRRTSACRPCAARPTAAGMRCLQRRPATGTFGEVSWRVWHPPPADWERQRVRNDDSIVLELRYRGGVVLLPGDIGRPVEQELASAIPPAPFRILKVPHHGSLSSSSAVFVRALLPRSPSSARA